MEPEVDLQDTVSLKHLALACTKRFQQLSKDEETQKDGVSAKDGFWASRQSAEFNLWCAKVGVNSEGLRSMDVRLKDVPGICKVLLQLLRSLSRDLDDMTQRHAGGYTQIVDAENDRDYLESGSESSSLSFEPLSSSEDSELQIPTEDAVVLGRRVEIELRQHIADTIDRLEGQSRRIERAAAQHRRKRVEIYREKEVPNKVYEGFKELAAWKAKEQFKLASETIKGRIAESFARRRIRFEYLKEHQKKRAVDMSSLLGTGPASVAQSGIDDDGVPLLQKQEASRKLNASNTHYSPDQQTLFSATVDTKYDLPLEPRERERPESVRSIALRHPGFPPPPKIKDGKFQCPYCLLEFRDREAEPDYWKQHVMQDLEPYFCTVDECEAPYDVPNSFDGLLDHLQSHLPMRHHVDEPDGEHREYVETEFEQHVKNHGEVSEQTMAAMKEASRRKGAFLFDSCPFCGGYPDVLEKEFPNRETLDAQRALRKHIKQHMQEISLFLPPYRSDIFNKGDGSEGSDVTHRQSRNDELSGSPDECETICGRNDCDCKDAGEYAVEDNAAPEHHTEFENATEHRWTCCQCGGDNSALASQCTLCYNHSVEGCPYCNAYEHVSTYKGDWSYMLRDPTIYNRSKVTDAELFEDSRLHSFIMRFAFEDSTDIDELERSRTPHYQRVDIVRHIIEKETDLHYRDVGRKGQPPLATDGGLPIIRHLFEILVDHDPQDHQALWAVAKNGQLEAARQLLENADVSQPTIRSDAVSHVSHDENELDIRYIRPRDRHYQSLHIDVDESTRTEAFYKDTPVWIEWKLSWRTDHAADYFNALNQWMHSRVKDLVAMLKELNGPSKASSSGVPHCLGYFRDEEEYRFGLVFENPSSAVSLRHLLTDNTVGMPSAADRMHAMRSFYATIESVHAAGYLHQGIRSNNVLFFTPGVSIKAPYISGFSFSRLDPEDYTTYLSYDRPCCYGGPAAEIYYHPMVQHIHDIDVPNVPDTNEKYVESHDFYSVGLVLLEFAHWKPIERIMDINSDRLWPMVLRSVRHSLLHDKACVVEWVRDNLGNTGADVIRACIEGTPIEWPQDIDPDFGNRDDHGDEEPVGYPLDSTNCSLCGGSDHFRRDCQALMLPTKQRSAYEESTGHLSRDFTQDNAEEGASDENFGAVPGPSIPRGILRRPTEKFPEGPEPVREGVAPHKDALKGKDIPNNARWTRIDRRLVNPEALEQAKERFEERQDCVIVLRVLTKQEIKNLAYRTKAIRERREDDARNEDENLNCSETTRQSDVDLDGKQDDNYEQFSPGLDLWPDTPPATKDTSSEDNDQHPLEKGVRISEAAKTEKADSISSSQPEHERNYIVMHDSQETLDLSEKDAGEEQRRVHHSRRYSTGYIGPIEGGYSYMVPAGPNDEHKHRQMRFDQPRKNKVSRSSS